MKVLHFSIDADNLYLNMKESYSEKECASMTSAEIEYYLKTVDLTYEFIDEYSDEDNHYNFKYEDIVEVREDDCCTNVYDDKLKFCILNYFQNNE